MERKHLEVKLARASTLPILPYVTLQLLKLADKPNASAKDYESIIMQDPAMVAKLLRTANSPFFGGGGRITSLQRAILMLGVETVRSICIVVSLQSGNTGRKPGKHFNLAEFWQHSITVACMSKVVAVLCKYPKPEEAFLAGLMHDIGKLGIALFLPEDSVAVFNHRHDATFSDYEIEKQVLSMSHEEVGYEIATRWQLPQTYWGAIAHHHVPMEGGKKPDEMTLYVHVGNSLAYECGLGFGNRGTANEIAPEVRELLPIGDEQYARICTTVYEEVQKLIHSLAPEVKAA